jgi:hypothetical protein
VKRYSAPSAAAVTAASPASTKLALGTTASPKRTTPSGSNDASRSDAAPRPVTPARSCITDWR